MVCAPGAAGSGAPDGASKVIVASLSPRLWISGDSLEIGLCDLSGESGERWALKVDVESLREVIDRVLFARLSGIAEVDALGIVGLSFLRE